MKKQILLFGFLVLPILIYAQNITFPEWGYFTDYEKTLTVYERDSSANAVVLSEYGYSYVEEGGNYNILKKYYVRIKILNAEGYKHATVKIPTYKKQFVKKIKGQTSNIDTKIKVSVLEKSDIHKTKISDDWGEVSFTLPNIKPGSIIEYTYTISTPYHHTFADGWIFQNELPKVNSTYYAKIPGFWKYHISKTSLFSSKAKQYKIIEDCMQVQNATASCLFLEYSVDDIPAFIEEDFATSKYNYLMQLKFELESLTNTATKVTQITESWKNVEKELFKDYYLGKKYGKTRFFTKKIPLTITNETNQLEKAKKVFTFIQNHYNWNNNNALFTPLSNYKKAYKSKVGNMVEINLSLVNALLATGINADIALLSTRDNGVVTKLHPVISDFNYFVAHIKINGKDYFLDAVDKDIPFGMLPFSHLNGKIRVFKKGSDSYWYDYKPSDKNVTKVYAIANITEDAIIKMKTRVLHTGYEAYEKREDISANSIDEYKNKLENTNPELDILTHTIENLKDKYKPLIETIEFETNPELISANTLYLKPFTIKDFTKNPFTLKARNYPVDLGYTRVFQYNLSFNIPKGYSIKSVPENRKIVLGEDGGSLIYVTKTMADKININFAFSLDKTIYQPKEYQDLKDLFVALIKAQNEMIVLTKD